MTDHTLVSFPDAKGFLSKKTIIGEMWVERLSGEMISTSRPMFTVEWPGFHKFTGGPSLMTFFSGSPASGWTRNCRLDCIELPWVCIVIVIMNLTIINNDFYEL